MEKIKDTFPYLLDFISNTSLKAKYPNMEMLKIGSASNALFSRIDSNLNVTIMIHDFKRDYRMVLLEIQKLVAS